MIAALATISGAAMLTAIIMARPTPPSRPSLEACVAAITLCFFASVLCALFSALRRERQHKTKIGAMVLAAIGLFLAITITRPYVQKPRRPQRWRSPASELKDSEPDDAEQPAPLRE